MSLSAVRRILAIIAVVLLGIAGGAAEAKPVHFATGVDGSFMPLIVAVDKGFMKKHGLDADYKQFAAGGLALEAVVAGEADVALAAELPSVVPKAKGAKFKTVARAMYSNKLIGVAARGNIRTAQDFVGKAIGYSKGTASDYYMGLYFKKHGIDPRGVKLVNVAPPELVPTMARGDIQVMFSWEPWFTRLQSVVTDAHVVDKSGDGNVYTLQYLLNFSEAFLNIRPDEAKQTLLAISDAIDWLNDPKNKQEAAALLSKTFRVPVEDAPRQLEEFVFVLDLPKEFVADVVQATSWIKDQGIVAIVDPNALVKDLIDPSLLRSIAPAKVQL